MQPQSPTSVNPTPVVRAPYAKPTLVRMGQLASVTQDIGPSGS